MSFLRPHFVAKRVIDVVYMACRDARVNGRSQIAAVDFGKCAENQPQPEPRLIYVDDEKNLQLNGSYALSAFLMFAFSFDQDDTNNLLCPLQQDTTQAQTLLDLGKLLAQPSQTMPDLSYLVDMVLELSETALDTSIKLHPRHAI